MFSALLGPALSFGSSLLSGLGSRQSAKKQQKLQAAYEYVNKVRQEEQNAANERNHQFAQAENREIGGRILAKYDLQNIARDADKAGFNPATWLAMAGPTYGAMIQTGYGMMTATPFQGEAYMMNAPTAQVPSMLEVAGGAITAGVNTYLADARVTQSQNFQREMLQTQISAIQRNGGKPLKLGSAPASAQTFFGSGSIPYAVAAGTAALSRGITAPGPNAGSGVSGSLISVKPHEVTATNPLFPYLEPGRMPEVSMMDTFGGGLAPAMSKDAKDRLEEDFAGIIGWNIRNRVMPTFGEQHGSLPNAGWGMRWEWSPFLQEYRREVRPAWDQNYTDPGTRRTLESPYKVGEEAGPFQPFWTGGSAPSGGLSPFPPLQMRPWEGSRGW